MQLHVAAAFSVLLLILLLSSLLTTFWWCCLDTDLFVYFNMYMSFFYLQTCKILAEGYSKGRLYMLCFSFLQSEFTCAKSSLPALSIENIYICPLTTGMSSDNVFLSKRRNFSLKPDGTTCVYVHVLTESIILWRRTPPFLFLCFFLFQSSTWTYVLCS